MTDFLVILIAILCELYEKFVNNSAEKQKYNFFTDFNINIVWILISTNKTKVYIRTFFEVILLNKEDLIPEIYIQVKSEVVKNK